MTDNYGSTVHCVSTLSEVQNIETALQKRSVRVILTRLILRVKLLALNFIISFIRRLWFSPFSPDDSEPPSIVIYAHGTLGDHVVHLPALVAIRERFLHSAITLVTYSGNFPISAIVGGTRIADTIITLSDHPVARAGRIFHYTDKRLEKIRCDLFINFSPFGNRGVLGFLMREMIFARKLGARSVCGFRMNFFDRSGTHNDVRHYFVRNEPRRAAAVLREINIEIESMRDYLPHSEIEKAKVLELLQSQRAANQPIVVLNPGAKLAYQYWSPERYGDIARWLLQTYNACVVVNGTDSESPLVEKVVAASGNAAVNFAGTVTVQGLIELVRLSALCVTNNTGTMHVAAAVGTPTVALFGTRWTPTQWFPLSLKVRVLFSFSSSSYIYADDNQPDETLMNIRVEDTQHAITDLVAQEKLFDKPKEGR